MSRRRRGIYAFLVVGAAVSALYVARGQVLPVAARWLDVGERPRACDYALVLGGGANSRPFVAAALVKLGLASKVLVIRGASSPDTEDGINPPDHELGRQVLMKRGVPAEDIAFLGTQNSSTYDEAVALSTFLEAAPGATVTVVTHGYHTRRARWIFSRVLGSRCRQLAFVSVPPDGFRVDEWWRTEQGFVTVAGENLKMGFYLLRYDRFTQVILACIGFILVFLLYGRRRGAATKRQMDSTSPGREEACLPVHLRPANVNDQESLPCRE